MKNLVIGFAIAVLTICALGIGFGLYAVIAFGAIECLIVVALGALVGGHYIFVIKRAKEEMPSVLKFRLDKTTIEEIEKLAETVEFETVKFTDKYLIIEFEG